MATTNRRVGGGSLFLVLVLAGCTGQEVSQPPAYAPPAYSPPAVYRRPPMPARHRLPDYVPPVPQPASPEMAPDAVPPAAPVSSVDPTTDGNGDRYRSLKSRLEQEGAPSALPAGVRAAPVAAATGDATAKACGVPTRSGFHDHYGGLNSAGDVHPSCNP